MSTLLLYNNYVESSTIVASSEDASYPASNIQVTATTKEWRTESAITSANVVFDLGSAQSVDYLFLVGNALDSGLNFTSITLQANSSDSWGAPAYDSGAITSFPENLLYLTTGGETYRYWRLVIEDTSGASFTGFSNLFLGSAITLPNNNIDRSWSLRQEARADIQSGLYGQRFITKYNKQKSFNNLIFNLLTKDELDILELLFADRGVSKPVWFMLDSAQELINTREKLAGYFWIDTRPVINHTSFGLYSISFSLTQVI